MRKGITTGNAAADGKDFHFWFVGQIERWCKESGIEFEAEKFGLRSNSDLEIKWGIYKEGEERSDWASCSDKTAMSILIRGDLSFTFRDPGDSSICREVRLKEEGDYVIWREDMLHTWRMDRDSVILTIRWLSRGKEY
jgi:hypothetical protein